MVNKQFHLSTVTTMSHILFLKKTGPGERLPIYTHTTNPLKFTLFLFINLLTLYRVLSAEIATKDDPSKKLGPTRKIIKTVILQQLVIDKEVLSN